MGPVAEKAPCNGRVEAKTWPLTYISEHARSVYALWYSKFKTEFQIKGMLSARTLSWACEKLSPSCMMPWAVRKPHPAGLTWVEEDCISPWKMMAVQGSGSWWLIGSFRRASWPSSLQIIFYRREGEVPRSVCLEVDLGGDSCEKRVGLWSLAGQIPAQLSIAVLTQQLVNN